MTELVEALLAAAPSTRWLRDPTRAASAPCATSSPTTPASPSCSTSPPCPSDPAVSGACDLLGIDPLYVANEGKFVAVVPPSEADAALEASAPTRSVQTRRFIGDIRAEPEGIVVLRTSFGGTRIVDMLVGDPLPRIC